MKRILKYFGYFHYDDLVKAVDEFDLRQMEKRNRLIEQCVYLEDKEIGIDAIEEGYQGVGALFFVAEFLNKDFIEYGTTNETL